MHANVQFHWRAAGGLAFVGVRDDLTESSAGRLLVAIPLCELAGELVAKAGELSYPFLDRPQMAL